MLTDLDLVHYKETWSHKDYKTKKIQQCDKIRWFFSSSVYNLVKVKHITCIKRQTTASRQKTQSLGHRIYATTGYA